MNKSELIAEISKRSNVPALQTEQAINFAIDIISEKMSLGEKVYIVGLGTFQVHKRSGHSAVNPRTGEKIEVEAYDAPVFRAAEPLKRRVRNRNKQ
ncbi:MAG: HU family DNA-binding protein [Firmicutes bacterium]|nr:HU family DNA-binding protein [Bacillota bacterium]